jgi:hypothetical protein
VTGLWIAVLDKETRQARAHLRATRPDLFPAPPEAQKPAEPPQEPTEPPQEPTGPPQDPAPASSTAPAPALWTAPWDSPSAAPAAAGTPWTVPAQARDEPGSADDPDLRAALIRIAADMPHVHLSEPVLSRISRRRRIRAATWTTVSLGTLGAFVALVAVGVSAVARNVERATPDLVPTGTQASDRIPEALPARLTDPIQYAYMSYCEGGGGDSSNPQPCGQWRLTTTSGKEWRLHDARAGYDKDSGTTLPLAVSHDGHRLAYRDTKGSYVVRDLPTGTVKTIEVQNEPVDPHITASPNGRYFAVDFRLSDGATLDFDTGVTHYDYGDAVQILAVRDDGLRVIAEQEDVSDVPGHASITTLRLSDAGSPFRIDPGLIEYGGALSPDGHTLALVTQDTKVITMDAGTGRVTGRRTALEDYEVLLVERWISADEVLVRQWDDEYAFLTKVNVRSGATSEFAEDTTEWLDYDSPLGVLED